MDKLILLLGNIVWPSIILIFGLMFRKQLKEFLTLLSSADEVKVSVGKMLDIEARTIRDINRTVNLNFRDDKISKAELEELLRIKEKSKQAAMDRITMESEMRSDRRITRSEKIRITTESGEVFDGEILNISRTGIAFKSIGTFRFFENVKISPLDHQQGIFDTEVGLLRIVRIELAEEGYNYGAMVTDNLKEAA